MEEAQGGRIFFSSTGRSLVEEDEIVVLSVGVDIGSSTSHLVFSRIVLERLDSRYVVSVRETFHQSDILLTPYSAAEEIDAQALGAFIERQYKDANIEPDEIDTGALILTGFVVRLRTAKPGWLPVPVCHPAKGPSHVDQFLSAAPKPSWCATRAAA